MAEQPEPRPDEIRWEKPDFAVSPLSDLERPGPDREGDDPPA